MTHDTEGSPAAGGGAGSAFAETSRSLIFRAAAGEEAALATFAERYREPLFAWLRHHASESGNPVESAEGYVQGFFAFLFKKGLLGRYAPRWKESPFLSAGDVRDSEGLARRLAEATTGVVAHVRDRLSESLRACPSSGEVSAGAVGSRLVADLNTLLAGPCWYEETAFLDIRLRSETRQLLKAERGEVEFAGYWPLCLADLENPTALLEGLRGTTDGAWARVRSGLGASTRVALSAWEGRGLPPRELLQAVVKDLNRIVRGPRIEPGEGSEGTVAAEATLSGTDPAPVVQEGLGEGEAEAEGGGGEAMRWNRIWLEESFPGLLRPHGARLNRLLLEDVFGDGIVRQRPLRFRSFLLRCLKHWYAGERRRPGLKRVDYGMDDEDFADPAGDLCRTLPADREFDRARGDMELPADREFDRAWARGVMARAEGRLRKEYERAGRGDQYEILEPYLRGDRADEGQEEIARRLGMSHGAVRGMVHRMRKRFGELLSEELAAELPPDASLEERAAELKWVVMAARDQSAPDSSASVTFSERYREPLCAWLRHHASESGNPVVSAEDHVQGFFEFLFRTGLLGRYAPSWNESPFLVAADVRDSEGLARRLAEAKTGVVAHVRNRLPEGLRALLSAGKVSAGALGSRLVADLNAMLAGPCLYGETAFGNVLLRWETRQLLAAERGEVKLAGYWPLCLADLENPTALLEGLRGTTDGAWARVRSGLGVSTRAALSAWEGRGAPPRELLLAVVKDLNRIEPGGGTDGTVDAEVTFSETDSAPAVRDGLDTGEADAEGGGGRGDASEPDLAGGGVSRTVAAARRAVEPVAARGRVRPRDRPATAIAFPFIRAALPEALVCGGAPASGLEAGGLRHGRRGILGSGGGPASDAAGGPGVRPGVGTGGDVAGGGRVTEGIRERDERGPIRDLEAVSAGGPGGRGAGGDRAAAGDVARRGARHAE